MRRLGRPKGVKPPILDIGATARTGDARPIGVGVKGLDLILEFGGQFVDLAENRAQIGQRRFRSLRRRLPGRVDRRVLDSVVRHQPASRSTVNWPRISSSSITSPKGMRARGLSDGLRRRTKSITGFGG